MDLDRGKRFTVEEALTRIPTPEGRRYVTLYEYRTLQVEMYAPRGMDPQQPHTRDEAYIVGDGFGSFFCDGLTTAFGPGDFLFVPAGVEHHFEDFRDDLAVWVLFYGPEGGEGDR